MDSVFALWRPILEILFIWGLFYYLIQFLQGTRAMQVLMGLIILAIIFNIAKVLELNTINWVLTKLFAVGVLAFLIIFQPELRRALARIGQNTFAGAFLLLSLVVTMIEIVRSKAFSKTWWFFFSLAP